MTFFIMKPWMTDKVSPSLSVAGGAGRAQCAVPSSAAVAANPVLFYSFDSVEVNSYEMQTKIYVD